MPLISIFNPCFNEVDNVIPFYEAVKSIMDRTEYSYEHVFIDNCSTDGSLDKLRALTAKDECVRVIVNRKNFGPVRSTFYGLLQCKGDAVIAMAVDFQDPPEKIPELLAKWEEGYELVLAVKEDAQSSGLMPMIRKMFYRLIINGHLRASTL